MKSYFCFFLIINCCVLFACNSRPYEREKELYNLLEDICGECRPVKGFLFLLVEDVCSSCQHEDIQQLKLKAMKSAINILIITTDSTAVGQLKDLENIEVVFCPLRKIQASGVSQASSFVFEFNDSQIIDWLLVNDNTMKKIGKKL